MSKLVYSVAIVNTKWTNLIKLQKLQKLVCFAIDLLSLHLTIVEKSLLFCVKCDKFVSVTEKNCIFNLHLILMSMNLKKF